MRISKYISRAQYCSRRQAELLVSSNKVKINGENITNLATQVSLDDRIEVEGEFLKIPKIKMWSYYKPRNIISTYRDPQNRNTIFDQIRKYIDYNHFITVGRLDVNSEGLMLVTNSGDLARHLMLPDSAYSRVYRVRGFRDNYSDMNIDQIIDHMQEISRVGINIDGEFYSPFKVNFLDHKTSGSNIWFEITIFEGKNREVRKLFQYFGIQVNRLIRIRYGPIGLEELYPSEVKQINQNIVYNIEKRLFNTD